MEIDLGADHISGPLVKIGPQVYERLNSKFPLGVLPDDLEDVLEWVPEFLSHIKAEVDSGRIDTIGQALLYIWTAHHYILRHLQPSHRALPLISLDSTVVGALDKISPYIFGGLLNAVPMDIDGNVFGYLLNAVLTSQTPLEQLLGSSLSRNLEHAWSAALGPVPSLVELRSTLKGQPFRRPLHSPSIGVLPFAQQVLTQKLDFLRVSIEADTPPPTPNEPSLIANCVLASQVQQVTPAHHSLRKVAAAPDQRARKKMLRREQRTMSFLQRQADSMTGALGTVFQHQIIPSAANAIPANSKRAAKPPTESSTSKKGKPPKVAPLSKAEKMKLDILKQKTSKSDDQADVWWKAEVEKMKRSPLEDQLDTLDRLSRNPKVQETPWLKTEMALYRLHVLVCSWIADTNASETRVADSYRIRLLQGINSISIMPAVSTKIRDVLSSLLRALGLAEIQLPEVDGNPDKDRKLSFSFEKTWSDTKSRPRHSFFPIQESAVRFQLRMFGPYMDRSMDSQPDPRTSFDPDGWQVKVLDCIDNRTSSLVIAPTSAG